MNENVFRQCYLRGLLNYKLHAGQLVIDELYNKVNRKLFVANCSRRFGKSFWVVVKLLSTAYKSKTKSVIATAFKSDLIEFILPLFETVLEDCPEDLKPIYNKQRGVFTFYNGSEIRCVGLDKNPKGLRGNKINGLIAIDEAAFVNDLDQIYSQVLVPTTMYSDAKIIFISTPPKSPGHPFVKMCEKAKQENSYIKLSIYDNPMVTPEDIEQAKVECLTQSDFLREYCGEFVLDDVSAIVPEFNLNHVSTNTRDEYFKYYHKYVCFDIGVRDPTFFLFAYWDFKKQCLMIEFENELKSEEVLTPNIAKVIRETSDYTEFYKEICDSNNLILVQDLNALHGRKVVPTSKTDLLTMVSDLRTAFKNNQINIHPRCEKLINQLQTGIWSKDKTKFERLNGHHFDAIAALIYLWRGINKEENPISVYHNFDPANMIMPNQQPHPLTKLFKKR